MNGGNQLRARLRHQRGADWPGAGALLSGPLADWLGRKKIIVNSVFFFGFWTIATAFSQNIEQMIFFRFMTGLGLGAAMPNIGTLVSEYAPSASAHF
jgi:AAHS family 4-hydroxybenzoate transporter-like MFS transporter